MDSHSPLAELRGRLALAIGENAVFDGWTEAAVDSSADQLGIDRAQARLAAPRSRAGLVETYVEGVDDALAQWATPERMAEFKVRDRIRALVWKRLEIMAPAREAVRQGLAILAMPNHVPSGARIGWRTADLMWRLAGDSSTDINHYTKRLTLGAVYASTLLVWLDDRSEGWIETAAFLDRRIADVMRIERVKAQWRRQESFSLARFLGRLRYPPR